MFVITVKFVIHEKDTEKFKVRILQQARDSLELEKDCHEFDVCHDPNNKNIVFLYETYTDKDAFDIHHNSQHYLSFNEEVTPWVKEKIVTQLEKQVLRLVKIADEAKLYGVICSPLEIKMIKKVAPSLKCFTPGIRQDKNKNDQKRTMNAKQALEAGSDCLIIGRPITKGDPKKNIQEILSSLN